MTVIVVIRKSFHTCEQDYDKMEEDLLRVSTTAKQKVCEYIISSIKKIYEQTLQQLPFTSTSNGRPYNSVEDVLHRHRKSFLQVQKTEIFKSSEGTVPNIIEKDYLIAEFQISKDGKMLIFSSHFSKRNM